MVSEKTKPSDQGIDVDYQDVKISAKGKEIVLYICLALTAIYAVEKSTQVLLCVCKRLNNTPHRRNQQYFAAQ